MTVASAVRETRNEPQHALAAFAQGLEDLSYSGAAELTLVRGERVSALSATARQMERCALSQGFAVARLRLGGGSLASMDRLVRAVLDGVKVAGKSAAGRGFVSLLEAYARQEGPSAAQRLSRKLDGLGAHGDLARLSTDIVAASVQPSGARRAYSAWLAGTELRRSVAPGVAVAALSVKSAKYALAELTRVLQALGHRGCLILLPHAEKLTKLTPAKRRNAYVVLRELVDNMDNGLGLLSTRLVLLGGPSLFEGKSSIQSLQPLHSRLALLDVDQPAPPHRPIQLPFAGRDLRDGPPRRKSAGEAQALRALIRAGQGLPPSEAVVSLSVGYGKIDRAVDKLLTHSAMNGSVFTALTGDYGSGKTHLLRHLAERALGQGRPVLRLSIDRMNLDLGNPQRHLLRLVEHSELPCAGRPTAVQRLNYWLAHQARRDSLMGYVGELAGSSGDASSAARRLQRQLRRSQPLQSNQAAAIINFLCGTDLRSKPGLPNYRQDAYCRLLLWLELLRQMDGVLGPVLLIDEAENLYGAGATRAERRTALRSLSFYCGGALPGACVILALTPTAYASMSEDSAVLLEEIRGQRTVLSNEDVAMLQLRLKRLRPIAVPALTRNHLLDLAERVRETHRLVRPGFEEEDWDGFVQAAAAASSSPRAFIRQLVDFLESQWWRRETRGRV